MAKLAEFFAQPDKESVSRTLASYGVKYFNLDSEPKALSGEFTPQATVLASGNLSDCLPYYSPQFRSSAFQIGAQTLTIDSEGRAGPAIYVGGPGPAPIPGARPSCQTIVGTWGNVSDEGGHLIPSVLGGSPYRLNLTPQDGQLNEGPWRLYVEGAVTFCREFGNVTYSVAPIYAGAVGVRLIGYIAETVVTIPKIEQSWSVGQVSVGNMPLTADQLKAAATYLTEYKYICSIK